MATELGQAYVQIMPSAQGIKGSIQNVLNGEADSAGASAGSKIGSKIKGALLAAGIGQALKSAITEGAALEQSIGGIETLFKDSAKTIENYAVNAWKTAGISANNYMELATSFSASLLQSLSGDTKQAAEVTDMAIKDMSDNANKMGTDMQSIQWAYQGFARQNYTMLDNLKLGYGGTKEEMQRLLADAQKLTGVKYDISNLSDVYEAIHVIQGELGITGTTALEAEQTLSGSFNSMKAAAQNLMGLLTLGGGIQSVSQAMANLVQSACTFLFNNLIPAIGNIILSLPSAIGTFIVQGIPQIVSQGAKLIDGLITGINQGIPQFASTFPQVVQSWLSNMSASLPSVLSKGGELLLKFGQAIVSAIPTLLSTIATLIPQLISWITSNIPLIAAKGGELIAKFAQYIILNIPQIIAGMGKLVLAIIQSIATLPATLKESAMSMIASFVSGIIPDSVKNKFNQIKNAITDPIDTAKENIRKAINKIKSFFNISLKFKDIKMPHISVTWKTTGALAKAAQFIGLDGIPKFSVSWYKTGGIFNDPSIIGVGEAGSEAVVPLDKFWARLDSMTEAITESNNKVVNLTVNINQPVSTPIETARAIKKQMEYGLAGV